MSTEAADAPHTLVLKVSSNWPDTAEGRLGVTEELVDAIFGLQEDATISASWRDAEGNEVNGFQEVVGATGALNYLAGPLGGADEQMAAGDLDECNCEGCRIFGDEALENDYEGPVPMDYTALDNDELVTKLELAQVTALGYARGLEMAIKIAQGEPK